MLRTSVVRVINPSTKKSTLAYAQHDTAAQLTLISKMLKNELNLGVDKNRTMTIRIPTQQTTSNGRMIEFTLRCCPLMKPFKKK